VDIAAAANVSIQAFIPPPGGGLSNILIFPVRVQPTVVFVDDDWAGLLPNHVVMIPGDPTPHYFGYDAFDLIQNGIDAVAVAGTVNVRAGTYPEYLLIQKDVTVAGPNAIPPAAVLAPTTTPRPQVSLIEVGDPTDAGGFTVTVHLSHLRIDGTALHSTVGADPFNGVTYRPRCAGSIQYCTFINIRPADPGIQNGFSIASKDSMLDIENNTILHFGKQAITVENHFVPGPGVTVNIRNNQIIGINPVVLGAQLSQNAIVIRDPVSGEISGNRIEEIGPSGPTNAAFGDAKIAGDGTIGFAILLTDDVPVTSSLLIRDNIFNNCQGIFCDGRFWGTPQQKAASIKANAILTSNTVIRGRYIVEGPLAESSMIQGLRCDDPNMLNYTLTQFDCTQFSACEVVVGPMAFAQTSDLVNPTTYTLLSRDTGDVTIALPNPEPDRVVAGPGVTFLQYGVAPAIAYTRLALGPIRITGPLLVTSATNGLDTGRNQLFIQDEVGPNNRAGMLVDDPAYAMCQDFVIGDQITDMIGTVDISPEGMWRFTPLVQPILTATGLTTEPLVLNGLTGITFDDIEAVLVRVNAADVTQTGFWAADTDYALTAPTGFVINTLRVEDGSGVVGEAIPPGYFDVIGIAVRNSASLQVQPRIPGDVLAPSTYVEHWYLMK
jgi:hypothetical protein